MNNQTRTVLLRGGVDYALTKNQLLDMLSSMKARELVDITMTHGDIYRLQKPSIEKETEALRQWSVENDLDHKKGSTAIRFLNEIVAFDLNEQTFITRNEVVEHSRSSVDS